MNAFASRLGVLAERNFRVFYVGYVSSMLGTAMSSIAVAFAVLDTGQSASVLGVVFAAEIVPQVLLLPAGGVIADRLGRRRVMLTADTTRSAARAAFAALLAAGPPPVWVFVAFAVVEGAGDAVFRPAVSGLTVEVVPAARRGDANALLGMARPAAGIAGPALAGMLVALTSPAVVIAVDAASYAVSVLALALVRLGAVAAGPGPGEQAAREPFRKEMARGWAEFRAHPWLVVTTAWFALFNLLVWGPYLVLGPVLAKQSLGGAGAWGAIIGCYGAGAVAGGVAALGRRPRRPVTASVVATFGYAVPPALLAAGLPTAWVAAGAAVAGTGSALGGAFAATAVQQQVDPAALARVSAVTTVISFSFGPLTFAAAGPVAALVGARAVLGFGAAWCAASAAAVLCLPAVRAVTWRSGDHPPAR